MARTRHGKADSTRSKRGAQRDAKHIENLRLLSKRGRNVDPTNARAVARAAAQERGRIRLEEHYSHKVTKQQARTLRERGFYVTKKGVAVDAPRDAKRRRISGAKMRVSKSGTVVWSVANRRDYIVGFTKKEKRAFVQDRTSVIEDVIKRLRAENPNLRKVKRSRIQVRLQWGAFQATKDFSPYYFTKNYFSSVSPEDLREGGDEPRADKLTGLHFVIHTPTSGKKGKNAKRRKRK